MNRPNRRALPAFIVAAVLLSAPGAWARMVSAPVQGPAAAPAAGLAMPAGPGYTAPIGSVLSPSAGSLLLPSALPSLSAPKLVSALPGSAGNGLVLRAPLTVAGRTLSAPAAKTAVPARLRVARSLAKVGRALRPGGRSAPAAVLRRLFDKGVLKGGNVSAVLAVDPAVAPGSGLRRFSLDDSAGKKPRTPSVPASGKASARDTIRKVWEVAKRGGALLGGLYGGMKVGDIVYSLVLRGLGLFGGLVALLALGGIAYYGHRRGIRSPVNRFALSGALVSLSLTVLGQILWDVTGLASLGLGLGLGIGILLALAANGVFRRGPV